MAPKSAEWYQMQISKGCPDKSLKIKIAIRIDKPQNMKHAGSVSAVIYITLGKTLRQIKVENERNLTCKILQCQRVSTVHNK